MNRRTGRDSARILLAGAGVRGAKWARVIAEAPDATLAGIVDLDDARARRARDAHAPDAPVERDFASALSHVAADAVVIATPPDSHHSLVSQSFNRGLDVLCEKPLSDEMDEVLDLIARADDAGRHLLVGMNFRYLPTSRRIRHYAQSGELGALSYGHFTYHRQRDGNRHDLSDYVMTMPHPMLLEQSIHHFDLLRYCYAAEVESLVCDTWRPSWSTYEDDCCVSVLFRFENGVRANYLGTWTAAWNRMDFRWRTEFEDAALIQREQFEDLVRVDFDRGLGLRGSNFKGDAEAETPVPEPPRALHGLHRRHARAAGRVPSRRPRRSRARDHRPRSSEDASRGSCLHRVDGEGRLDEVARLARAIRGAGFGGFMTYDGGRSNEEPGSPS